MIGELGSRSGCAALVVLSALVWSSGDAYAQQPDKEFTIAIGETLTFSSRGVDRLFVGIDTIANPKTSPDGRQIEVTGLKEGTTTINIYTKSDQRTILVRVVPLNPVLLAEEARQVLGSRSGVDVRVVNGRVLLEGEVASETFKRRIDELVKLYPTQVLNFTTYRESFVEGAKMVAMEVDFVQLAVTDRDQLGVKWGQFIGANYTFGGGDVPLFYSQSPQIGEGVLPGEVNPSRLPRAVTLTGGNSLTSYMSMVGNLNAALDFMVDHGIIKTIQHGVLVTEAGTEGEYLAGGTLLVQQLGAQVVALERIPYGLSLKATPVVDLDNRVKISLEVSYDELDAANGINGVPALRTTKVKGVVNMQEGQSVLISGLTSSQTSANEQGWWMLSRIPFLGWLFKSRQYLGQNLDNALFITPRLYEPGGKVHSTLVKGIFEEMLGSGFEPEELPKLSNAPMTSARPTTTSTPSKPASSSSDDIDFGDE